jgi:hypothetical protein
MNGIFLTTAQGAKKIECGYHLEETLCVLSVCGEYSFTVNGRAKFQSNYCISNNSAKEYKAIFRIIK